MAKVQQGEGGQGYAACEALVKKRDKDRYYLYAALRAPSSDDLLPLFAFNTEIAKTRDVVSEPTLGLIRLQWWREALEAVYKKEAVPAHEVMTPLAAVISRHDLPQALFEKLLVARERDLDPTPFVTRRDYLEYILNIHAPLDQLALKILGQAEEDPQTQNALSRAYGMIAALRLLSGFAFTEKSQLPLETRRAHGVPENLESGQTPWALLSPVVDDYCRIIDEDLCCSPRSSYFKALKSMSRSHLKRIVRSKYHIFDQQMDNPPLSFLLRSFFWGY